MIATSGTAVFEGMPTEPMQGRTTRLSTFLFLGREMLESTLDSTIEQSLREMLGVVATSVVEARVTRSLSHLASESSAWMILVVALPAGRI